MQKIVTAITGASGSIYARQLLTKLQQLRQPGDELAVVMTENAKQVWQTELGDEAYKDFDIPFFGTNDFTAPFASGSGQYNTMIIVPCSMGTLGRIAGGISNDLISRTADVMLKERRKLICVARETPYNLYPYPKYGNNYPCGRHHLPGHPFFLQQTGEYGRNSRYGGRQGA